MIVAALAVLNGCAVATGQDAAREEPGAVVELPRVTELRTNCAGAHLEGVVWAVEQWERAVPSLELGITLAETELNLMCVDVPELPRSESTPGGILLGNTAIDSPRRVELYAHDMPYPDQLLPLVALHELGHFLTRNVAHHEPGRLMATVPDTDAPACISTEDLEWFCRSFPCDGRERATC